MGKFSNRSTEMEIMDDLDCSGEVVHKTLHEIEFINRWLGGNTITLQAVKRLLLENRGKEPIHIADLGCGGGGMLAEISKLCQVQGIKAKLTGIDANSNIIEFAKNDHQNKSNLDFICIDIFSDEFRLMKFDIILCTLVAHHFSNEQLSDLFSNLKSQARLGVIINDLQRNPIAFYSIKWLTRLFSRSSMVKFDAPLSVLRGFKRNEIVGIMKRAGIEDYNLNWRWAFRWRLKF